LAGPEAGGWRIALLQRFAVLPGLFRLLWSVGEWPVEHLIRLVAYPLVHAGFMQVIFVVVFVLALGKMVGEVFAAWIVLAVFFGAGVFGAIVFSLVVPDNPPLIGGFPGAYGLIGAYTFILWVAIGAAGGQQAQAFTLIAFLMGIQLLFGLIFGGSPDWVAELAGFFAGFAIAMLVSPGGFQRVMKKLRQR